MSCGSISCTSTAIPIAGPPIRLFVPDLPAISLGALAQEAWARVLYLAELRNQRLALRDLDDRLLADIGVSRADAQAEAQKPFWLIPGGL